MVAPGVGSVSIAGSAHGAGFAVSVASQTGGCASAADTIAALELLLRDVLLSRELVTVL